MRRLSTAFTLGVAAWLLAGPALASTEDNRSAAVNAMTDLFSRQDPGGVDRYFTSPYLQHNMHAADGLDALKGLAREAAKWKGVHTDIRRSLAEGDLVVLHSVYWNLLDLHKRVVAFDLFRFKDGKIVEHWDALEPVRAGRASGYERPDGPTQADGPVKVGDPAGAAPNRALVGDYVRTVLIGGRTARRARFVDPRRYVEHRANPRYVFDPSKPDLSAPVKEAPGLRYVALHRMVAEGDFVFVQGEGRANGQVIALYDLYRVERGKIVEHWDVRQPIAPRAQWANPNGPF